MFHIIIQLTYVDFKVRFIIRPGKIDCSELKIADSRLDDLLSGNKRISRDESNQQFLFTKEILEPPGDDKPEYRAWLKGGRLQQLLNLQND